MIRTRIAPSPTWNMHIWTARAALFNYLFAKQNNWKFLIRIEDTDKERSLPEHTKEILKWLEWLGLSYDEDIVYQSKNEQKHIKAINYLLENNYAYYSYETPEELQEMKEKAQKEKKPFVYRQINYTQEQLDQFKKEWRNPVVRFKVPDEEIIYNDLMKWEISFNMSNVSDFVIQKSDGSPIFYIANAVDDHLMDISHVIRWEDHISNTPKQILLYKALWYNLPSFWHLPLLLNPNKSKMSKRDTSDIFVTVKRFMQEWFLKDAVINFIALLWWHTADDREFFYIDELLEEFSNERVQSSNSIYDFSRAIWFNGEHIRALDDEQFIQKIKEYVNTLLQDPIFKVEDEELISKLRYWEQIINEWKFNDKEYNKKWVKEIKVRLQTFKQFVLYNEYIFDYVPVKDDILYNEKMKVTEDIVKEHIPVLIKKFESIENWDEDTLKNLLITYNKENWLKNGQTLWPIRSILSWVAASPWAFELMEILWKKETIKRLKKFID